MFDSGPMSVPWKVTRNNWPTRSSGVSWLRRASAFPSGVEACRPEAANAGVPPSTNRILVHVSKTTENRRNQKFLLTDRAVIRLSTGLFELPVDLWRTPRCLTTRFYQIRGWMDVQSVLLMLIYGERTKNDGRYLKAVHRSLVG
jgi:hypothetical protein